MLGAIGRLEGGMQFNITRCNSDSTRNVATESSVFGRPQ